MPGKSMADEKRLVPMNFYVANWYVDSETNRITSDKQAIKLESKVMSLLVYLAKNQGNVVSREQLEADVWTDRVISYDALTSCITRLRKVLGDDSRNPVYIETVSKKGYRLIAPVRFEHAVATSPEITSVPTLTNRRKSPVGLLLTLAVVLSIAALLFFSTRPNVIDTSTEINDAPSIVVLPFDNLSRASDQTYFSDGITADIQIALSKLSGLQVITPTSVLAEKNEYDFVSTADNQQQARYILTGSVQRADNKLRVNVTLLDNQTHHHLWAESYDREITAVFDVQDDITAKIVATLSIKLTEEETRRIAHRFTNSIEAYDQFLRGQALYTQHTSNENLLARERLQQAIKLDPNFARAYSTLALTYVDAYRYQWFIESENLLLKTLTLAEKAVAIDDKLPQAFWALAYAKLHMHQYQQAIDAINLALAVSPNYADGYAILALIDLYRGDAAEGLQMIRKAMRLDPNYPAQYVSVLGQAHFYLGEYETAAIVLRDAIDKNFSLLTAHIMLTASLNKSGAHDEASWSAEQLHTIAPKFAVTDVGRIFPLKDSQQLEDIMAQLRSAGLK